MNIKNLVAGLGVILALVLGFVGATRQTSQVVIERPSEQLGALTGPDIASPYISVGGLQMYSADVAMRAATTTLCAIQAPASTSTLRFAGFTITTGTSTAATIDIGTSTTAFATTTNLSAANSVASGAQGSSYWQPVGGAVRDSTMAPNEWVVFKTAGAGLGGYTYTGTCSAQFYVL